MRLMGRLLILLLLLCLACALPVSASAPPWGVVSANPAERGMLIELRVFVEGATAVALTLPPEVLQIERPTIEPGSVYAPLGKREWATAGDYQIKAVVSVGDVQGVVIVPLRVVAGPEAPAVWRVALPVVVR